MKKPKWVRGKALETVLALKALREGDEVQIWWADTNRNRRARVGSDRNGNVTIKCPCTPRCGLPMEPYSVGIQITGWRRLVDK